MEVKGSTSLGSMALKGTSGPFFLSRGEQPLQHAPAIMMLCLTLQPKAVVQAIWGLKCETASFSQVLATVTKSLPNA